MKIVLPLILFSLGASLVNAHEAPSGWNYDDDCCSTKDCHVIPPDQTPKTTPDGYLLHDGHFVSKDEKARRDSQDIHWHRCDGVVMDGSKSITFVRCLYVPSGGF